MPLSVQLVLEKPVAITTKMRYVGAFINLIFWGAAVSAARTRLTWVNGIGYSLENMETGQIEISKMFGGKRVEYYHNVCSATVHLYSVVAVVHLALR